MKIDPKELYSISFYEYGEAYYGSCGGTRYRLAREPLKNVHYTARHILAAAAERGTDWPENLSRMSITPLWSRTLTARRTLKL